MTALLQAAELVFILPRVQSEKFWPRVCHSVTDKCCDISCFLWLQQELEKEAKKPEEERTSETDTVVDMKNQSIVQTIHIDNLVICAV